MNSYNFEMLLDAYAGVGVTAGSTIYVTSDLFKVRGYEKPSGEALVEAHLAALLELLGPEGTLIVPTSTLNLLNTEIPFDPIETPSYYRGALSEAVRTHPKAKRSFHPIQSYAALGPRADFFLNHVPRHSYGVDCVEWRMVQEDVTSISVGQTPARACTTMHLIEVCCGVPYRYTKEFMMNVSRDGRVLKEPFYFPVYYQDTGLTRDNNRKIFKMLESCMEFKVQPLGAGKITSYSMKDFFSHCGKIMSDDLYIWCDQLPSKRPYQK